MTPMILGIPDEILQALRVINVFVMTFTALAIYVRFMDVWSQSPRGLKITFFGIATYFVIGAYSSGETYVQSAVYGLRGPFSTLCCLVILWGIWMSRREQWFTFDYGTPKKPEAPNPHDEDSGL